MDFGPKNELFRFGSLSATTSPKLDLLGLARAGFYFTEGKVKCFECGLEFTGECENREQSYSYHATRKPECPHYRSLMQASGNAASSLSFDNRSSPSDSSPPSSSFSSNNDSSRGACGGGAAASGGAASSNRSFVGTGTATSMIITSSSSSSSSGACGSNADLKRSVAVPRMRAKQPEYMENAKHPSYADYPTRLGSYEKWPSEHVVEPKVLADSGFYYAGFGDCVRCFCCGNGLRNWEYGDEPDVEHARWYPNCKFIRFSRSQEFVNTIQRALQHLREEQERQNNDSPPPYEPPVKPKQQQEAAAKEKPPETKKEKKKKKKKQQKNAAAALKDSPPPSPKPQEQSEKRPSVNSSMANLTINENPPPAAANGGGGGGGDGKMSVSAIADENKNLKTEITCIICFDRLRSILLMPCGHVMSCKPCANTFRKCPVCRKLITEKITMNIDHVVEAIGKP